MSDFLVRVKTSAPVSVTKGWQSEFWDVPGDQQGALLELERYVFQRIARAQMPGILSVEVQANDFQDPSDSRASGQPAVGWIIAATAGNTTLTVGTTQVIQAFTTSQAITAVNLIQLVNGDPNLSKLVTASADPNGVTGKVILTMNTLGLGNDHIIGGQLALTGAGTGVSVSAATIGGTNTAPARSAVAPPSKAVNL